MHVGGGGQGSRRCHGRAFVTLWEGCLALRAWLLEPQLGEWDLLGVFMGTLTHTK